MDNITHTLIGVLVGESLARAAPASSGPESNDCLRAPTRRNLFVAMMAVGGALPDLDFLYSAVSGGKLDYLLHHRGHTHTVLGALPIAAVLLIGAWAWLHARRLATSHTDRISLVGVALLAPLLHIAMDFANNYGVHPFWPFYNGWLYGDSIFIVEPLLWAACAPLAFTLRTRVTRGLLLATLAIGIALSFFSGLVRIVPAIALTVLTVLLLAIGKRAPPRIALACGLLCWLGVTAMFATAGRIAADRTRTLAAREFPQAQLLDHVLTPTPVNPLCWEVLLIQVEGDELALRRAMLSLAPSLTPAQACVTRTMGASITAPMQQVRAHSDREVEWHGEVTSSRSQLAGLLAADCRAAAFMRFARAPWLASVAGGLVLGDLRYDREAALGFAEIELGETNACPARVPPWSAPRADVFAR